MSLVKCPRERILQKSEKTNDHQNFSESSDFVYSQHLFFQSFHSRVFLNLIIIILSHNKLFSQLNFQI